MLPRLTRNGYTLIEMLVVAAIIGLLTGAGIAAYARYNQRQQVEQAAMSFAGQLRLIQKRADAGERISACASLEQLTGYHVAGIGGNSAASVEALCGTPSSAPVTAGSVALTGKAQFASGDNFDVMFKTVAGGVNVTDGDVVIEDVAGRYRYKVTVEAGGIITVERL